MKSIFSYILIGNTDGSKACDPGLKYARSGKIEEWFNQKL